MKTLSTIALLLFATATLSAQNLQMNDIPLNLQNSFSKAYANAMDVEWEKDADSYKVEFEINKLEHEIWYTSDGTTIKIEKEVDINSVPSPIKNAVNSKYSDYRIDSVEITEEGNKKTYELEIEKGWMKERTLVVDSNGNIMSDMED